MRDERRRVPFWEIEKALLRAEHDPHLVILSGGNRFPCEPVFAVEGPRLCLLLSPALRGVFTTALHKIPRRAVAGASAGMGSFDFA